MGIRVASSFNFKDDLLTNSPEFLKGVYFKVSCTRVLLCFSTLDVSLFGKTYCQTSLSRCFRVFLFLLGYNLSFIPTSYTILFIFP